MEEMVEVTVVRENRKHDEEIKWRDGQRRKDGDI